MKVRLFLRMVLVICCLSLLTGCASEKFEGYGKIQGQTPLAGTDKYAPKSKTLIGGATGFLAGSLVGAGIGAGIGALDLAAATTSVSFFPPFSWFMPSFIPSAVVVGAIGGAVTGMIVGGVTGIGTGYIADINSKEGKGPYQFDVIPLEKGEKDITVKQNIFNDYTVGEKVKIFRDYYNFIPIGYHIAPAEVEKAKVAEKSQEAKNPQTVAKHQMTEKPQLAKKSQEPQTHSVAKS